MLADVPAASLADEAPLYERPLAAPADLAAAPAGRPQRRRRPPATAAADLLALLADPSWVYRQYDHQLFLNTVEGPGGDAALLRLAGPGLPPSGRGVAVTTDANPRWCALDPRAGTALVLAEGVANLACVGARAVAVVNCLNFGNPEHPEVMWQLSEAVDGLADGLPGARPAGDRRQRQPLQRERRAATSTRPPVIGVLGLVRRAGAGARPGVGWDDGATVVLLGARGRRRGGDRPHPLGGQPLGGGGAGPAGRGAAPARPRRPTAGWSTSSPTWWPRRWPAGTALLCGAHDVSGGGLGVALAEMAVAVGASAAPASTPTWPATPSSSPSCLPGCWWPPTGPTRCWTGPGGPGCRPPCWAGPAATAWSSTGLVDLPLAEVPAPCVRRPARGRWVSPIG